MEKLVINFPNQLRESLEIAANAVVTAPTNPIHNIVLAGLGGSGIGGNMVAELIKQECKIPFAIYKGYELPTYVNENTLVILSSYSGNTEETLAACTQAEAANAKIIAITSGGKIMEIAKAKGYDLIVLPGGMPPRSCLGYSMTQQVAALHKYGFISDAILKQLEISAEALAADQDDIREKAKKIAHFLFGKIPVIYATDRMDAVAVRFRQQINENSKMLCWHHVIPEMNHNELVGWRDKNDNLAVILFRNEDDYIRNQMRLDINKEVFETYTNTMIEVWSKGNSLCERMMYFVHLGDFISTDLAALRNLDATEVKVIDYLKNELSKVAV
ncbi:MAG: bifunctional phosphoglucose/phosphomannose isomerase [Bacteroidota bacterium]|jgi:glucose/mannose-6-phosphate isomerase